MRRALHTVRIGRGAFLALVLLVCAGCERAQEQPATEGATRDAAVALVERALPRFRDARPAPRDEGEARLALAREHVRAQKWEQARALLEVLLGPENGAAGTVTDEARLLLGIVHQEAHRPLLALPLFEAVLERGPSVAPAAQAFYFYGKALADAGRAEGARAAFEADRSLFPSSGDPWFQLALLDVEAGEPAAAREKLEQALTRFRTPRDQAKAHARLGDLALAQDQLEEAERRYLACVELFPHYEVFYKLAGVARRRGDEAAAAEYLRRHEQLRERATQGAAPAGLEQR